MRTQIYDINLVIGAGIPPIVKVSQNDELRVLAFRLFDGIREYFPYENEEVTITGTKPSGLGFTEVCNIIGSIATVETTLAMTQESGHIKAELRISDGSTNIGTANFVLYVEPSPHPDGTTDGTTEEARTVLEQCEYYAGVAQDAASAALGDYTQLAAEIGTLSELTTTAKSSAVAAINEVNSSLSDVKADLGDLSELETETKTDLVSAINEAAQSGGGLTSDVKEALLDLLQHIKYTDNDDDYYGNLANALYPIISISAVYTQSGTVYDNDPLNSLKDDLVVTAQYDNSTTKILNASDYTLSGTLNGGTCTITVTCGSKTTTFDVVVTSTVLYTLENYPIDRTMTGVSTGLTPLESDQTFTITFDGIQGSVPSNTDQRILVCNDSSSNYKGIYLGMSKSGSQYLAQWMDSGNSNNLWARSLTNTRIRVIYTHTAGSGSVTLYAKVGTDAMFSRTLSAAFIAQPAVLCIGGVATGESYSWVGTITKCAVYNRALTEAEIVRFFE